MQQQLAPLPLSLSLVFIRVLTPRTHTTSDNELPVGMSIFPYVAGELSNFRSALNPQYNHCLTYLMNYLSTFVAPVDSLCIQAPTFPALETPFLHGKAWRLLQLSCC